eukprot:CAMPEP_0115132394 /NCGR_PEP_ID=MMETSP0227-20121206/53714_1 /TAXON_ID=89957 /ORGANISM="Polarella glacialis, Strain CCMP 1383" /LENGTH=108 /DNA_ID=CAMNT_0002538153 /DNA_START=48 /DNA_END=370 /DNA_ORIENTATION=-
MTERHVAAETSAGAHNEDSSGRRRGRGRGAKKKGGGDRTMTETPEPIEDRDHGVAPPGAPSPEEIKKLIADRNSCRKLKQFDKADEIRDDLKDRGVILSDEKGAHGDG